MIPIPVGRAIAKRPALTLVLATAALACGTMATRADSDSPPATIERAVQVEKILGQQLTADVNARIDQARDLLHRGAYEEAREALRNGLTAVRGETQVGDATRNSLLSRLGGRSRPPTAAPTSWNCSRPKR